MSPTKDRSGKRMWPFSELSYDWVVWWGDLANIALLISLLVGVVATFVIVRTTNVKEHHWEILREKSNERIAETNARAAEANKVAEGERLARLKLEKEMAWRTISEEQRSQLITAAKPFTGQRFEIITYQDDPECLSLANQIARSLIEAGWLLEKPKAFLMFPIVLGVNFIIAPSKESELAPAVNTITPLFDSFGLPGGAGLEKAYDNENPEMIRIKIGKKPERISR